MKEMEQKILTCGKVLAGDVLRVDNFLNHQIDVDLLSRAGQEFYRLFRDCGVTKVLTIEASGIAVACLAAQYFHVPVVFAKKSKTVNTSDDVYLSQVASYTHKQTYDVTVSKDYLTADDKVLIIDDFLALGSALTALLDIVAQSGATAVGCGIVIEKAYQNGGADLRAKGIRVESLARIAAMSAEDGITFCEG